MAREILIRLWEGEQLRVVAFESGVVKKMKKVIIHGNRISGVDEHGTMYATLHNTSQRVITWDGRGLNCVDDAVRLGILPRKRVADIRKAYAKRQEKVSRKAAALDILSRYSQAQLKLTEGQLKGLRKLAIS